MRNTVRDLGVGAVVGYFGSRAMDRATGWYFESQSKESRQREEEIAPAAAGAMLAAAAPARDAESMSSRERR